MAFRTKPGALQDLNGGEVVLGRGLGLAINGVRDGMVVILFHNRFLLNAATFAVSRGLSDRPAGFSDSGTA